MFHTEASVLDILSKMPNQNVSWLVRHVEDCFSLIFSFAQVFAPVLLAKPFEKKSVFCYLVVDGMVRFTVLGAPLGPRETSLGGLSGGLSNGELDWDEFLCFLNPVFFKGRSAC